MKLRTKILTYTLPLILIPFLLMALAVYYFVIRANQIQIQEENSQRLNEALVSFSQEIDSARKDIKILSNVPSILSYLQNNIKDSQNNEADIQTRTILELFFKQNPYYLQFSLVNEKGQEVIKFSKLPKGQGLKNLKNEDYFRRTLILGNVQTPVREIQTDKFATIFTQSINTEDKFWGVLVLTLNTEVFEKSMRPLLQRDLVTFLFDDRGVILADTFQSVEDKKILDQTILADKAAELLASKTFVSKGEELVFGQKKYNLTFLPSEAFPRIVNFQNQVGSNWFLGVLSTQKATPIPFEFQLIFFSILILAIASVLYLAAKASSYITIPLEQVSVATDKIARGESDINLKITTGDEVEDLANAVNQMNLELQDYQKQIVQTAKLASMGEMTSEISHEIQNRISGISLWLQHLDSEIEEGDPRQEYLDEMKQGLNGFMGMLGSLKQYYKTPVLELEEISLNSVILETLPFVQEKISNKKITIHKNFDTKLPLIKADREKIRSVILNLIINAIDAIDKMGTIHLFTGYTPQGRNIYFEITDNGHGIDERDFSRIYYPFFSRKSGGSGLGLAISSNIVLAHQGRIELKSEIGKGATFRIYLPTSKFN